MADRGNDLRPHIEAAVRRFSERHHLLPPTGTVVVAVSGGADSLCLLGVLETLCRPSVSLVVAHLNHGLRGEPACADAAWVAALAGELGLPCRLGECDVAELASRSGHGVEAAGRQARYAFLREVAHAVGAQRICVGHTRDDQVETLVMRWLRGSALSGLVGMRPLADDIARPLLGLTRAQTHAYCAARGWAPREDPTNQDRRYWRNRIRHEVLPALVRENPSLADTLTRNAELLADDEAYLAARAEESWSTVALEDTAERMALDVSGLTLLAPAVRRRVLRIALTRLAGAALVLESRHVLDALAIEGTDGRSLHLPAGLSARIMTGRLVLSRRSQAVETAPGVAAAAPAAGGQSVELPVPGYADVPGTPWRVCAQLLDAEAQAPPPGTEVATTLAPDAHDEAPLVPALRTRAYLDADAVGEPLRVATWRHGDRFRPLGMEQEKKLQDYFVDAKVPRSERPQVPLVWGPRHLVWVAGHRIDDRARIRPATHRVLALRLARRSTPAEASPR